MDQHLAHGNKLDRCGRISVDRFGFLCAGWLQGPGVPGQQDPRWPGCCADDHIRGGEKFGEQEMEAVRAKLPGAIGTWQQQRMDMCGQNGIIEEGVEIHAHIAALGDII